MSHPFEWVVDTHLDAGARYGDEVMVRCIFHDDSTASMQFNVEKGVYVCFACGARGGMRNLSRQLGIGMLDAVYDVQHIRQRLEALGRLPDEVDRVLEESVLKRYAFPTRLWKERGFTEGTIKAFDLGYSPMGDDYGPFLSIPMRTLNGDLIGIIKRYTDPKIEKNERYRYPWKMKKSHHIFGSWLVAADESTHEIVLVEGSTDAMMVWQAGLPGGAILGNSLSVQQVRILRMLGITTITTMFDGDKGGADATDSCLGIRYRRHRGKRVAEYLPECDLRRDFIVYAARRPLGDDPGGVGVQGIKKAYAQRVRLR